MPLRRAATEFLTMNSRGRRPPGIPTPLCHSRLRIRRRRELQSSSSTGFRPPDPPPPRIWGETVDLERHAGPRAPAGRTRRRRAPWSTTAGGEHADAKTTTTSTTSSTAPPAETPPYPTVCTSRHRGSPPSRRRSGRRRGGIPRRGGEHAVGRRWASKNRRFASLLNSDGEGGERALVCDCSPGPADRTVWYC